MIFECNPRTLKRPLPGRNRAFDRQTIICKTPLHFRVQISQALSFILAETPSRRKTWPWLTWSKIGLVGDRNLAKREMAGVDEISHFTATKSRPFRFVSAEPSSHRGAGSFGWFASQSRTDAHHVNSLLESMYMTFSTAAGLMNSPKPESSDMQGTLDHADQPAVWASTSLRAFPRCSRRRQLPPIELVTMVRCNLL